MKKGIADYQVGEKVEAFLLIKSVTKGTTQAGKPFLTLIFQDKTAEIEAKLWDSTKEDEERYHAGGVVKVAGEITSYRGRNQLRLFDIHPADPSDGVTAQDFLKKAPLTEEEMLEVITQYIFEIRNSNIQRLTRYLLRKHHQAFLKYPAATTNHHEYVAGLAYHVVSMLKLANAIADLYPSLNKDLLYAGVILHDLGKVIELSGSVAPSYTTEGILLGHISIMIGEMTEAAKELGIEDEEVLVLKHMVLSHHGKAEWGSPKPPLIKEAEILHYIDNIDAKMNMLDRVLERVEPGEFSERVFAMDNRSFYKPTFT